MANFTHTSERELEDLLISLYDASCAKVQEILGLCSKATLQAVADFLGMYEFGRNRSPKSLTRADLIEAIDLALVDQSRLAALRQRRADADADARAAYTTTLSADDAADDATADEDFDASERLDAGDPDDVAVPYTSTIVGEFGRTATAQPFTSAIIDHATRRAADPHFYALVAKFTPEHGPDAVRLAMLAWDIAQEDAALAAPDAAEIDEFEAAEREAQQKADAENQARIARELQAQADADEFDRITLTATATGVQQPTQPQQPTTTRKRANADTTAVTDTALARDIIARAAALPIEPAGTWPTHRTWRLHGTKRTRTVVRCCAIGHDATGGEWLAVCHEHCTVTRHQTREGARRGTPVCCA